MVVLSRLEHGEKQMRHLESYSVPAGQRAGTIVALNSLAEQVVFKVGH